MNAFNLHNSILFFLQIGVMLFVSLVFGQLMRRLHQPAVLGELIGGILLGPTVLGFLAPHIFFALFPENAAITHAREGVIQIGMLFFLFVAGLEINLSHLRQNKWSILCTSLFGFIFPFGIGFGSILIAPDIWRQPHNPNILFALFIGIALSISALPVIARILMELRLLHRRMGIIVMTAASINDIIGWSFFAVLLSRLNADVHERSIWKTVILIAVFSVSILGFGRWKGKPFFKWVRHSFIWPNGFICVIAVFILITAAIAEALNIHAIFGAFLVGVALYHVFVQKEEYRAREIIYQFAMSLFAPLYFVSIGLKVNFISHFDIQLVLLVILLGSIGTVGGATLGALISKVSWRESLAIGFGMNARGAMEIILASTALEYGLINQEMFVALVIMALVTSMLSGPLLQWILKVPRS